MGKPGKLEVLPDAGSVRISLKASLLEAILTSPGLVVSLPRRMFMKEIKGTPLKWT